LLSGDTNNGVKSRLGLVISVEQQWLAASPQKGTTIAGGAQISRFAE
jgi:hypothetical protein